MATNYDLRHSYPFPWEWHRTRYSNAYLVQRVAEEQVQDGIIETLKYWLVDVIAIDAGMKRARGRMIKSAREKGLNDTSSVVNFKAGGLPAGLPDLHATLAPDGVGLYIEVKAPAWIDPDSPARIIREAGKATVEQLAYLDSKHSRGAICLVAWSVDDVMGFLGARLERNRDLLRWRP